MWNIIFKKRPQRLLTPTQSQPGSEAISSFPPLLRPSLRPSVSQSTKQAATPTGKRPQWQQQWQMKLKF